MRILKTITLLTFLAFNLQAQVKIYYEEHLTGKMDLSDIGAIQVSNFVGVDIDYIYKGWATDANGKEVLRIESPLLTQSRGAIDYYQNNKFDSWKKGDLNYNIINQSVDPASYSGQLIFHSDLVHPLDMTSIIARETKTVFLKNGLYVTASGEPITDPRLVNFDFGWRYEDKFTLDTLFLKMNFNNKNETDCCLPLRLEITQNGEKIYAASMEQLCIPPGKSVINIEQKKKLEVEVDNYNNRNKNDPIKVFYRLGDSSGSREISNISHSDFDLSFSTYTHHGSGLQFDFVNNAEVTSPFSAASFAVVFDENEALEKIEMLSRPGRAEKGALGMYHPFNSTLRREDFNGNVVVSTFRKDNLSATQWKAFLAYVNNVDAASLRSFDYEEIEILTPEKLVNTRRSDRSNRVYKGYAFLILDQESVTIYDAYYFSVPADFPRKFDRDSLDLNQALDAITYNGIQLDFNFENEELKALAFNADNTISPEKRKENFDKMRRYHYMVKEWPNEQRQNFYVQGKPDFGKLDQIIAEENITERSAIPTYIVIASGEVKYLNSESFTWDSVGIYVSYRAEKKGREVLANRIEKYDYKEAYKIESNEYSMGGSVNFSDKSENLTKDDENTLRFTTNVLEIRTEGQLIELSRLNGAPNDAEWLKAIVRYQNLTKRNDPVGCKVHKVQDWTFYVPDKKLEKTLWQKETICFLVDSGKHLYRVKLSVPSVFDKEFILNSLQIEDKQFQFEFNGQNLESIKIR